MEESERGRRGCEVEREVRGEEVSGEVGAGVQE